VYRQEVRPFSDKQIALLQNFAAQAVIAMDNARLITETQEALDQQTATAELLQVINASPGDLTPVFDAILETAMQLCDASFGMMNTYDGQLFHIAALRSVPPRLADALREPRPADDKRPVHQRLVRGEPLIHISDVMAPSAHVWQGLAELGGARTVIWVALRKDDQLLGTLTAYRREVRPFTDTQIALLQNFAAHAVVAMENARLLGELRERTEEVSELNRGLEARVAEQVDELGRVGRLKRFLAPQLASSRTGTKRSSKAIAARSSSCFATYAATPPSPRPPSPKRFSISCASITARWGRWSASSRVRSISSRVTGSWCSSTIRCHVPTRRSALSRWRWRCAKRRAS